jgi:hypothetical protein
MKTLLTFLLFIAFNQLTAQELFEAPSPILSNHENHSLFNSMEGKKHKTTDTLKLIYQRIDSLYHLYATLEQKMALEYKAPIENLKNQLKTDSAALATSTGELILLKGKISTLEEQLKNKDQQITKNAKAIEDAQIAEQGKQGQLDQLAAQLNQQIACLKNASYTLDPIWVNQLQTSCDLITDISKLPNYNWITDFKTKSFAISNVQNKIASQDILNNSQLESLKQELIKSYGTENANFLQLKIDYKTAIDLITNYSEAMCDVSENIDIVIGMKSFQSNQRRDFLIAKSYESAIKYPMLQKIIQSVIEKGYTTNPIKTKINCE